MTYLPSGLAPALLGPALAALLLLHPNAAQAAGDDHAQALAALADLKAAIGELQAADASYATDRNVYHRASQRAINALAGTRGEGYAAAPGTPADAAGAIGHIDALLDRKETPVWADPLRGAEANMRAAIAHLQDSLKARELMDYEIAASRALTYLEVARGRPTETGVLGGLEGALASTVLGVPADARQVDACAAPAEAPAYGTHGDHLAWVTLPAGDGTQALAEDPGGTEITVQGGMIVLHTAAAKLVADACASHAAAAAPAAPPARQAAAAPAAAGDPPALYTAAQAAAGQQVYTAHCVTCHGANLLGTAAPSVAGTDFLTTAQHNGWTLSIIRYLVFNMMPKTTPGSLTPTEYANVTAFLLAANCYPAGTTPFPATDQPDFAKITLGPVPGQHPGENPQGICLPG